MTPAARVTTAFVPCLARSLTASRFTPVFSAASSLNVSPIRSTRKPVNLTAVLDRAASSQSSSSSASARGTSNGNGASMGNGSGNGSGNGNGTGVSTITSTPIPVSVDDEDNIYYVDQAEETYRLPPSEIARLVDAPADPSVSLQPATKQWMILLDRPNLPPIEEVASEELRLAGFRINEKTYAPSRADYFIGLSLQRVDDPQRRRFEITGLPTACPSSAQNGNFNSKKPDNCLQVGHVRWAPDGSRFAFCVYDPLFGLELWSVDMETRHAAPVLDGPERVRLNAVCGDPFTWSSDSRTLVVKLVLENRKTPTKPTVPQGPVIQENLSHEPAPSRTFQDLLQTRHDKKLFEHYTACALALIDVCQRTVRHIGPPAAAFRRAAPSPDGRFLLVDMMVPPFAYMMPAGRFPRRVEVWDVKTGAVRSIVANIPLQDKIPIAFDGVGEGPRGIGWRADADATLYWAEAQDGGDPNRDAEIRDCVFTLNAPFTGNPRKLASIPWRYGGIVWGSDSVALLSERRYKTRSARSYLIAPGPADDQHEAESSSPQNGTDLGDSDASTQGPCCERMCDLTQSEAPKRLIFDITNWEDRYNDPGTVCTRKDKRGKSILRLIYPSGRQAVEDHGKIGRPFFMLQGAGASDEGDRPFLSMFDTVCEESTTIWRSQPPKFQSIVMVLEEDESTGAPLKVLIRQESQKENPNFFIVDMKDASEKAFVDMMEKAKSMPAHPLPTTAATTESGNETHVVDASAVSDGNAVDDDSNYMDNHILYPLTNFQHPAPELIGVQREIVNYERKDGVRLNASLYLPAGYDAAKDGPLPVFMWAYPREFKSAKFAGQMKGSPYRFVRLARTPLYWLTRGYAILDGPEMPIIGEGDQEANDTYIHQLVQSAEAAVDFLVEKGVGERGRMAIGGHSYGAFMTVNLLAHAPRLFCCGIARSGAYNRTLTPFGFQSEERTLWEARDVYTNMSPYMFAHQIESPLLLVHGDADNNPGTFPLQSERLYQALKGHGKECRYVNLPHEGHGYRARESVMHVLAEMTMFLDKHCNGVDSNKIAEKQ